MVMAAARNTICTPALGRKKPRKLYTIWRPREKWTADEHDSFVQSPDTARVQPRLEDHRAVRVHQDGDADPQPRTEVLPQGPQARPRRRATAASASSRSSRLSDRRRGAADHGGLGGGAAQSEEVCFADALHHQKNTLQLPLSPDDLRFADVYMFVGDVFGFGALAPAVEAQLQRLHGTDPVIVETILLVLRNLEDNLCA
ncbi:hypothetical protein EJB05_33409, partial [Eragrostis curvula]